MQKAQKRVLVAMADPLTRMNCAAAFVQAQWEVNTTGDGREALRILNDQPTDAMVLQLPLKVYDGLEVLRRIPLCGLYVCPGAVLSVHKGMEKYAEKAKIRRPFTQSRHRPRALSAVSALGGQSQPRRKERYDSRLEGRERGDYASPPRL